MPTRLIDQSGAVVFTGEQRIGGTPGQVATVQADGAIGPAAAPGGGGIASPLDLPGCALWLDASQIVGLNDADPVALWPDLSGQGNNAAQAVALNQPVYKTAIQNGLAVVRFAPTVNSQFLDLVAGALDLLNDKPGATLALVMGNLDQSVNTVVPFWASDNGDSTSQRLYYTHSDFGGRQTDGGTLVQIGASPTVLSPWCWYIGVLDWAGGNLVKNIIAGTAQASYDTDPPVDANSAATDSDLIRIGDKDPDDPLASALIGDLGEVVVYPRALNAREQRELGEYLSAKWATV